MNTVKVDRQVLLDELIQRRRVAYAEREKQVLKHAEHVIESMIGQLSKLYDAKDTLAKVVKNSALDDDDSIDGHKMLELTVQSQCDIIGNIVSKLGYLKLPSSSHHTQYDGLIAMLQMTTTEQVTLTQDEANRYLSPLRLEPE